MVAFKIRSRVRTRTREGSYRPGTVIAKPAKDRIRVELDGGGVVTNHVERVLPLHRGRVSQADTMTSVEKRRRINVLRDELRNAQEQADKKTIRRHLRNLGHFGGLTRN